MGEKVVLPFKEGRGSGRYIVAMVIVSGSYILFFNFIINKHKRNPYQLGQVFLEPIHQDEASWEEGLKEHRTDTKVVSGRRWRPLEALSFLRVPASP